MAGETIRPAQTHNRGSVMGQHLIWNIFDHYYDIWE